MVMFVPSPEHLEPYRRFIRPTPRWFADAGLGVFIHWGAYAVPGWAEPIGELGTIEDKEYWFTHNPYAEWYANTIRIDGSPAQQHQASEYGGAPYDDFLDAWHAEAFDPDDLVDLFRRAGARFVIPTTKHHDGITLWDAPGTHGRNTVVRGPRQDLVQRIADATRAAGLRFGVYYSSGLDWHAAPMPPITDEVHGFANRPNGPEYARYVHDHVLDLVDRYRPDVLWGDIDYPAAGQEPGPFSFVHVLDRFYEAVPDGVVNDRWGHTHWDFRTSEYEQGAENEGDEPWQQTRGIGYSFGYNRLEGPETSLTGPEAVRLLVDVVSRGGNLLLNVGPDAAGRLPEVQRACLEGLARWTAVSTEAVNRVGRVETASPSESPWIRWTGNDEALHAIIDTGGRVELAFDGRAVDLGSAVLLGGRSLHAVQTARGATVELPPLEGAGPHVVRFRRRIAP